MGVLRVLGVVLGLGLAAISILNVMGFLAVDAEGGPIKIDLSVASECFNSNDVSDCATAPGLFQAPDIALVLVGALLFFKALLGKKKRKKGAAVQSKKKRRRGRLQIAIGLTFIGVAAFDMMGIIQPLISGRAGRTSLPYDELFGIPNLPSFIPLDKFVQIPLLLIGLRFFISGRGNVRQAGRSDTLIEMGAISGSESSGRHSHRKSDSKLFKGKLESKGIDKFATVGDLRRAYDMDMHTDSFQISTTDNDDEVAGRTCHYCSGGGCKECNFSGEI